MSCFKHKVWQKVLLFDLLKYTVPVSILYKSVAGRYRPVRVADGPITARYRFIKNASWGMLNELVCSVCFTLLESTKVFNRQSLNKVPTY